MKRDQNQGPDFIGIGAQKAGTTWLYENLREQASIWLPPVKELHYFSQKYPNPLIEPRETLPHPMDLVSKYKLPMRDASLKNYLWLKRYYQLENTDQWYLSLFSERFTAGRLSGDITPAYSTLSKQGIQAVKGLVHRDTRVFIILRDPVERAWSSLKMLYRWRGIDVASREQQTIINDLQRPGITLRTKYTMIIDAWQAEFGEHFKVFLYRDLEDDALGFYHNILAFLGINEASTPSRLQDRIWSDHNAIEMPPAIREFLNEYYCAELALMNVH
jgi:hypothetical protein